MKLDEIKQIEVTRIGNVDEGIKASISKTSYSYIFEILTKGFYSNTIGSLVREITSNCFDSHIEAGVNDPVVISKTYSTEEGYAIEFKDVGVGLSPERIVNIYMNYFSSTKRETNEQHGGFGLGSKTPLAYADMFYILTRYNGKEYDLIMHRGEAEPELESLHGWETVKGALLTQEEALSLGEDKVIAEEILTENSSYMVYYVKLRYPIGISTEERNGTIIKVIMQSNDVPDFKKELKAQLAYFDNVYFKSWDISNDYDIYEGKYFKFRSDIPQKQYSYEDSSELHIVLGKVRYPIDFNRVQVPRNYHFIPIAVKFDIGELRVTPNRENLRYNTEDI
jgi:predicted DNA-binding ArsR family transcriptional regulator